MNTRIWKFLTLVVILTTMTGLISSGLAAATPEPPAGTTRIRKADGMVMVYVPAGEFLMGSQIGEGNVSEWPQHIVYLNGFWMDRTEVTNRQFEMFVQATGYRTKAEREGSSYVQVGTRHLRRLKERLGAEIQLVKGANWRHPQGPDSSIAGRENEPMLQTAWEDAQAYCDWAGARLPTEAEWEKAACGVDGRRHPWGDEEASCQYAVMQDRSGVGCGQGRKPWPVGSKLTGASPYGALDMVGNACEWVADWYAGDYYAHSPTTNPQGPERGEGRVYRSGSWLDDSRSVYSWCRWRWTGHAIEIVDDLGGFRCTVSGPAPAPPAEEAPGPESASRVLFIGDSNSRFLDRYLPRLAGSGEAPMTIESKAFATDGATLKLYSSIPVLRYPLQEIDSGTWHVVVLHQDLDRTWRRADTFCNDVRKFHTTITKVGAETVLLLPWDNVTIALPPTLQDTAEVYRTCGAELGVKVAPVGLAFERALRERPALNLYVADGPHANPRGLYLTLCVLYATLFERSPVGLTYRMDDVAAWSLEYALWDLDRAPDWLLSEEEAAFLQCIAWETVRDY